MKQSIAILIFLLTLTFSAHAQVDYIKYKYQYNLSCGIPDSTVIVRNQVLVDSLESMEIINGRKEYLYDYGWVYYMRYVKWKDLDDLKKATSSFEKGWTEYKDLSALWNLGVVYRVLGNCKKALDMTELYLKEVPDSISVDYKQVYYRYKNCRDKE